MEVCPYCKKPFKRLKSHLPHCKMLRPSVPVDGKAPQSKLATRPHTTERKRLVTDLNNTKGRESETNSKKRSSKLVKDKAEWTTKSFPPWAVGLERASNTKADEDVQNRVQCSLSMLTGTEPKPAFQGKTKARFYASENTTPKKELARDLPPSGERRSKLSETKASLPCGPVEPSSNQDRTCSSALPDDVQTASSNLSLDRIDPPRQKPLVKLLDRADGDYHSSPMHLHYGVERVRTSLSSSEIEAKARDPLSEVPSDGRDPEIQVKGRESHFLDFKVSPLGEVHVRESQGEGLDLGSEARGSTGNAGKGAPVTDTQDWASVSSETKDFSGDDSATERKRQDEGPGFGLFTPRGTTCSELLSVSPLHNENPASLTVRLVQEEKALACRPPPAPLWHGPCCGPQATWPGHQQPLPLVLRHASDGPFSQVGDAGRKGLSGSLGLEWFPELYPGYLGLGVLPGRPPFWNAVAQKPPLLSPQGERLSQGWVRCRTTVRSGVGGVTMLFAGYFVLWCSWSFRHLKLQRWRK